MRAQQQQRQQRVLTQHHRMMAHGLGQCRNRVKALFCSSPYSLLG
jgi:hypothetical protein